MASVVEAKQFRAELEKNRIEEKVKDIEDTIGLRKRTCVASDSNFDEPTEMLEEFFPTEQTDILSPEMQQVCGGVIVFFICYFFMS